MNPLQEYRDLVRATLTLVREQPYLLSEKIAKAPAAPPVQRENKLSLSPIPQVAIPTERPRESKKEKTVPPPQAFNFEMPEKVVEENFADLRKIFAEMAPDLYLHATPPSDQRAKMVKNAWQVQIALPDVPILVTSHLAKFLPFLKEISRAIQIYFGPCALVDLQQIEEEEKLQAFLAAPNLKCVIIPDTLLWSSPLLLQHYKETPSEKKRLLGSLPALLLPDLFLYKKDPLLKRSLWNVICQILT